MSFHQNQGVKNMIKISVIIPIYNVASYIKDCLLSVLKQDYPDFEVILVNDCTRDDSMEIIHDILKDNRAIPVRIVEHTENSGLSSARNTGIREAKGEYVYFLDSDDEIVPHCLSVLASAIGEHNPDMVIGDYFVQGSDAFFPPLKLKTGLLSGREKIIKTYAKERVYVMAWNKLVRRSFLLKHNLFFLPGIIHEDWLWIFQCACLSECWAIVKEITYVYKVRSGSIKTDTAVNKDIDSLKYILSAMVEFIKTHHLDKNRFVYSFIEEEKLRLLYTHLNSGLNPEGFANDLYDFIYSLRYARPILSVLWSRFKRRRMVRDIHYFVDPVIMPECFVKLPHLLAQRSDKRFQLISWVFKTWILYFMQKPQQHLF